MAITHTIKLPNTDQINFTARECTIAELLDDPIPDVNKARAEQARSNPAERDREWMGGLTHIDQAYALLREGWKQGGERLAVLGRDLVASVPQIEAIKRRFYNSDEGDDLRIDQAMAGDWDRAWKRSQRVTVRGNSRTVDLAAFWGMSSAATAEEIFWLGAASVAICDALENAGYSVRLSAVIESEHTAHHHLSVIDLKPPDVPLSIDLIAGVLCHAGVFRSLGFVEVARAPCAVNQGFGYPMQSRPTMESHLAAIGRDGAIVVPVCTNKDSAIKSVSAVLQQITDNQGTKE